MRKEKYRWLIIEVVPIAAVLHQAVHTVAIRLQADPGPEAHRIHQAVVK